MFGRHSIPTNLLSLAIVGITIGRVGMVNIVGMVG